MNSRPFGGFNSKSMEGASSSTTAVRNKRGDWLSRSKSGIIVKLLVGFAALVIVSATIFASVPLIKRLISTNNPTAVSLASINHNTVKNGTFEQVSYDDMLKSFGYNTGLEKDGLQICNLSPDSRNELGKGTWSLLHIMASTYPVNPTPEIVQDHTIFFQLLPRIYPCPDCRAHMRQMFHELPPKLNNRHDFMMWLCEAHNLVNLRLNKETFDCTKLDERWDCGCNIVPGQAIGGNGNGPEPETIATNVKPTSKKDRSSKKENRESKKQDKEKDIKKDRESRRTRMEKADHNDSRKSGAHVNKLMLLNQQTPKSDK